MDTLPPPPSSLTPKLKRRYIRCAKGTRRSRKDGKCYANK